MSGWYVSYRIGGATVMSLAKSRDEAINAACGLLDRKMNVREVGPLLGMRDPGEIIDSVEIRKLRAMRPQPDSAHVSARVGASLKITGLGLISFRTKAISDRDETMVGHGPALRVSRLSPAACHLNAVATFLRAFRHLTRDPVVLVRSYCGSPIDPSGTRTAVDMYPSTASSRTDSPRRSMALPMSRSRQRVLRPTCCCGHGISVPVQAGWASNRTENAATTNSASSS
jgi:hypothetical protein